MGKIELKFKDDVREFDLEKDEDIQKVKELSEKGWAYEEGQTKLKEVSKERDDLKEKVGVVQESLNYWDAALEQAKEGDMTALNTALSKMEIKIPEAKSKDPEFLVEEGDKIAEKYEKEIADLKQEFNKRVEQVEGAVFNQHLDAEHARLEATYNGKDGYPVYDRKAVNDHSLKTGIYDLDKAYKDLYFKEIVAAHEAKAQQHNKKIGNAASHDPDGGGEPAKPPKVYSKREGGYEAANRDWLKEMNEKGESLHTE